MKKNRNNEKSIEDSLKKYVQNEIEILNNKIKELNFKLNKKEDDIKNIINEKDIIIEIINNKLLEQEKIIQINKNEILELNKKLKNNYDKLINELHNYENKVLKNNEEINIINNNFKIKENELLKINAQIYFLKNNININNSITLKIKVNKKESINLFHIDNDNINEKDFEIIFDNKRFKNFKIDNNYIKWDFQKEGIYTIIIVFKKKLKNCSDMFLNCKDIISINLSNFDCSENVSCMNMFSGCESLKKINLGILDFSSSKNFEKMFFNCKNLIELNVSNFKTENSISFVSMFEGCSAINEINVSNFNSSKCENICSMFKGCKNITKIDMINWDMSKIKVEKKNKKNDNSSNKDKLVINYNEGINKLFYQCEKLNEIKMNLNFKDIKNLETSEAFKYISEKGTFIYRGIEGSEHFLKLLPEKWTKQPFFNFFNALVGLGVAPALNIGIIPLIGMEIKNLFS